MKTNRFFTLILSSAAIIFICSCSGSRQIRAANDLIYLKYGMDYTILDSMYHISNDEVNPNYEFEFDNQRYKAVVASIVNYAYKNKESSSPSKSSSNPYLPPTNGSNVSGTGGGANPHAPPPRLAPQPMNSQDIKSSKKEVILGADPFFLIFKDNKLYSWGYIYEFKHDPSNKVNLFGSTINDGYNKYLKSKE